MPAARVGEFDVFYQEHLAPVLAKYGLVALERDVPSVREGMFCRFFAVDNPGDFFRKKQRLETDPTWLDTLNEPAEALFGTGILQSYHINLYCAKAGSGARKPVGQGVYWGAWWRLGSRDGLPFSVVFDILEDAQRRLWIATGNGLCCYCDGHFIVYSQSDGLPDNCVQSLFEDSRGHLWMGTWGGLCRFDGETFRTYAAVDGLGNYNVQTFCEDRQGRLWIGTGWWGMEGGGISCFDGETYKTYTTRDGLADDYVSAIVEDEQGRLWLGTPSGLSCFDGTGFENYTVTDGLLTDSVLAILPDGGGGLWLGHGSAGAGRGGLSRFDGEHFRPVGLPEGLADVQIQAMLRDSDGHLWLGTNSGGLVRYSGSYFTTYTTVDGLANNQVRSLAQDHRGYIWVGTYGGGASRFDRVQFSTFTRENGLPNEGVMALAEDRDGQLWVGTWNGVVRYDGFHWVEVDELSKLNVWSIFQDDRGRMWFATYGVGVYCLEDGKVSRFTVRDGLVDDYVRTVVQDGRGRIWFGTRKGASCLDGTTFSTVMDTDVLCMLADEDSNKVWLGSSQGIFCYDGSECVHQYVNGNPQSSHVLSILKDSRGRMWFGTWRGGAWCHDGETVTNYTTQNGLSNDQVMSIWEDDSGRIWFGTYGGGVDCFDGKIFQSLSQRDGLVHDAVQQVFQDHNSSLWIATEGGLTRYRPVCDELPQVEITSVSPVQPDQIAGRVQLYGEAQTVAFDFCGHSRTTPDERLVYTYRLKGHDAAWRVAAEARVEYRDLHRGAYTFQVCAVDRDLNYSTPASVEVEVLDDPHLHALREALSAEDGRDEFVGQSPAVLQVQRELAQIAPLEETVLILGETGTGKGLAARMLHRFSNRAQGPFVHVNCGALPETLVESELFGYERGAFTGALARKLGRIELAANGTLFLDEIGDLPLASQVKLLRVLEEGTFERLGGIKTVKTQMRLVAATNRDLRQMMAEGRFREDLYFRLGGFPLSLPPLRQRREDIPLLAAYFAQRKADHLGRLAPHLAEPVQAVLQAYTWPGNVRELQHVMERAVVVCGGAVFQLEDIRLDLSTDTAVVQSERLTPEEYERQYIEERLAENGGNVRAAARAMKMHEATLRNRIKKLDVRKSLREI